MDYGGVVGRQVSGVRFPWHFGRSTHGYNIPNSEYFGNVVHFPKCLEEPHYDYAARVHIHTNTHTHGGELYRNSLAWMNLQWTYVPLCLALCMVGRGTRVNRHTDTQSAIGMRQHLEQLQLSTPIRFENISTSIVSIAIKWMPTMLTMLTMCG